VAIILGLLHMTFSAEYLFICTNSTKPHSGTAQALERWCSVRLSSVFLHSERNRVVKLI